MEGKLLFIVLCAIYFVLLEAETITQNLVYLKKYSKCPPGWGATKKCIQHSSAKCIKCIQGKTYSSNFSKSPCLQCSQCGIGLYESHKCTLTRDTICSECVAYLDHKNITERNDFLEKCSYLFFN